MDIQIQNIRKKNLGLIIDQKFAGSVDLFAKALEKNKFFCYGLLWSLDKPSGRKVTDKTSRIIENKLGLPSGFLDIESISINLCTQYISMVDLALSEQLNELTISNESIAISESELVYHRLQPNNLLALRINDLSMVKYFMPGDIIIIDSSKKEVLNNKVFFLSYNHQFAFRRVQRNLNDNQTLRVSHYDGRNEIDEVVRYSNVQIFGTPVMKIGALNI